MNKDRIVALVSELDELVTKEGAKVIFNQYGGGPDETEVSGTANGYLRLGIEFMKGGLSDPLNDEETPSVQIDIEYLVSENSNVQFDSFYRPQFIDDRAFPKETWSAKFIWFLIVGTLVAFILFAVFGAFTFIRMVF